MVARSSLGELRVSRPATGHAPVVVNCAPSLATKLKKPVQSKTCLEKASGMSLCTDSTEIGIGMLVYAMCVDRVEGGRGQPFVHDGPNQARRGHKRGLASRMERSHDTRILDISVQRAHMCRRSFWISAASTCVTRPMTSAR